MIKIENYNEIGAYHDASDGWFQSGVLCGECLHETYLSCPNVKEVEKND